MGRNLSRIIRSNIQTRFISHFLGRIVCLNQLHTRKSKPTAKKHAIAYAKYAYIGTISSAGHTTVENAHQYSVFPIMPNMFSGTITGKT